MEKVVWMVMAAAVAVLAGATWGGRAMEPDEMHWGPFAISGQEVRNYHGVGAGPAGSTPSQGRGTAELWYWPKQHGLEIRVTWSGLESPLTKIHIHGPAGKGENSSTHLLEVLADKEAVRRAGVGRQNGAYRVVLDLQHAARAICNGPEHQEGETEAGEKEIVAALATGRAYVNVHTERFGEGELRGQTPPAQGTEEGVWEGLALPLGAAGIVAGGVGILRRREQAGRKAGSRWQGKETNGVGGPACVVVYG